MTRIVKAAVTQVQAPDSSGRELEDLKQEMIEKHLPLLEQAAEGQG